MTRSSLPPGLLRRRRHALDEREREKKEGEHEGAEQGSGAWLLKKRKSEEKGEERGKKTSFDCEPVSYQAARGR